MAGTPVIDPASGTIYIDAFTREVVAGVSTNYFHRIHALNILNGNEQSYSPALSPHPFPAGRGWERFRGDVFSHSHMARPALTLAGGRLFVCYGSHDDTILTTAGSWASIPPPSRSRPATFSTPRPTRLSPRLEERR